MNFNSILLFSENPKDLAEFYKKILRAEPGWEGDGYTALTAGAGTIVIGPHDKVKGKSQNPERIMLNFEVTDVKGEFDRVKALGGKVIADPYHPEEEKDNDEGLIATFEDPDGNYFQLMSPYKS